MRVTDRSEYSRGAVANVINLAQSGGITQSGNYYIDNQWVVYKAAFRGPEYRKNLPKRGKLEDLQKQKSQYGEPIPRVWGLMRLAGQVIWCTDLIEHTKEVVTTAETGTATGGTSGGGETVLQYYYTVSLAIAICAGELETIRLIWAGDRKIYDAAQDPPTKYNIALYYGTEEQEPDPTMEEILGVGFVPGYRGTSYVVIKDLNLTPWKQEIPEFDFKVLSSTTESTVAKVLTDIFELCGLTEDDYDVTDVGYGINGYVLQDRATGRDGLEHLLRLYGVDLVEIDGKIVAVARGCSPAVTIDEDDLACRPDGGGAMPKVSTIRVSEVELPARLDLTYLDAERQYNPNTQRAYRFARALTDDRAEMSVPAVLTADGARQAAERLLYTEWLERTAYQFSVGPKYLELAPSSPVNLPVAGELVRARIIAMDIGLFGALQCSAVLDADYVLTQEAEGDGSATTDVDLDTAPTTLFTLWSVPEMRDQDGTSPGFYVAATSESDLWEGSEIWWSSSAAGPYTFGGFARNRASFGASVSTLASGTVAEAYDEISTVDVVLDAEGTLTSVLPGAVEGGQNRALLGVEVMGFATATETDPGEYTLSVLKRGLRGSLMTGHTSEDQFVRYSAATVVRISVPVALIGTYVYVKLLAEEQELTDVAYQSVLIGVPSLPYPTTGAWSYDFSDPQNSGYLPV